ncbi:nitroreductase family protein [Uruburuella testudinis]|uniref:Nitroreductase domain-containing protein n=3 Tax=Pseudomonadota TaxID=1224 RepID=A0A0A3ASW3_9PAST|nr:nitroreductase family protein [Uruburuella testudinis]KGQ70145.1 hypothetical protein OA57_08215 [Chelonobacter oris]UOO81351.1 nitroreductase family protein [Uruburuella testudinis]
MATRLLDVIQARHSVKGFDPDVKIPRADMEEMLRLAMLAPSSINLQPWRFVVVESEAAKAKLNGLLMFNQHQLDTASAMILALSDMQHFDYGETIQRQNVAAGYMPEAVKQNNLAFMQRWQRHLGEQGIREQGIMDVNLAVMQLMLVAKAFGYDSNAIGGFERRQVLDALGLDRNRYVPVMFLAIGKAAKPPRLSSRLPLAYTVSWNDGQSFAHPSEG